MARDYSGFSLEVLYRLALICVKEDIALLPEEKKASSEELSANAVASLERHLAEIRTNPAFESIADDIKRNTCG